MERGREGQGVQGEEGKRGGRCINERILRNTRHRKVEPEPNGHGRLLQQNHRC